MTARHLNNSLERANNIYRDPCWKWPNEIRLDLLTKEMSEDLRLKIRTDKKKDPLKKEDWTYDELEAAIKKHAVNPVDPVKLAREYINPFGEKIEDHLEALSNATQGINT